MREIKFRAWVKSYESMIYLSPTYGKYDFEDGFVASFVVDGYSEFGAHERYDVEKNDLILMQYTGLKDKNGKEIYEGDIVRGMESVYDGYADESKRTLFHSEVKFVRSAFCVIIGDSWRELPHHQEDDEFIEVIGNIYEHGELLNGKQ